MIEGKKPNLVLDEEYDIELYPSKSIVGKAAYLGKVGLEHYFAHENEDPNDIWLISMDDHWIRENIIDNRIALTYSPFSSNSVGKISALEDQLLYEEAIGKIGAVLMQGEEKE